MILSDILDRPVHDTEGHRIGFAVDVRFVVAGAPSQLLADAVLTAVLVSPRTSSSFFGYERTGVSAPWPIGALLKARHRGSFFVAWEDIAAIDSAGISLRASYRRSPLGG